MNILIISNSFYPKNKISSFRMNAFAKYFHEAGHDVTVVTEGNCDSIAFWEGCEVHYIKNPVIPEQQLQQHLHTPVKWNLRRIFNALEWHLTLDKRLWRIRTQKCVKILLDSRKYDVVLTTFPILSPHMIALAMRRKGYKFYWVADMRDEMSHIIKQKDRWGVSRRLRGPERRILDNADLVLSVSKPVLDGFRNLATHNRFLEIKNGYDYEEVHESYFQKHFTMGYIGRFNSREINPNNWFKAFSELICEGELPTDSMIKIVGNYVKLNIPDSIKPNVEELDAVVHDEAVRISIHDVDVLVMVHPNNGRKGVYSGKLLDYLATNKPIIAIYDPNDVVGALMEETNAGFAVDESDIRGIKEAIMKCYRIWQNREVLPRNWENIRQYSRRYQTQLLLDYLASRSLRNNQEE